MASTDTQITSNYSNQYQNSANGSAHPQQKGAMFLAKCGVRFNARNLRPPTLCPYSCTDQSREPCALLTNAIEGIRRTLSRCECKRQDYTPTAQSEEN